MPEALCKRLGVDLTPLMVQALTHRSWSEETEGESHNERLEYLGDAVLELAVTELIYRLLPESDEGSLSRIRAKLVRTQSLAVVGRRWDLGASLRLGRGEDNSGGRDKPSLLANGVEALLGAIYLDRGYADCLRLVQEAFLEQIQSIQDPTSFGLDPKSRLQELTMERWRLLPSYRIVGCDGPSHHMTFHCELRVGEHVSALGSGSSKKSAQRAAAQAALEEIDVT